MRASGRRGSSGELVEDGATGAGDAAPEAEVEMPSGLRVLVADADEGVAETCESVIRSEGHECDVETDADGALRCLERGGYDVVLLDRDMPGLDTMERLAELRSEHPHSLAIVLAGDPSTREGIAALRSGAWDYLAKPFSAPHLLTRLGAAAYTLRETRSVAEGSGDDGVLLANGVTILGVSSPLRDALEKAVRVARTDASVLLVGESGTGKELFARLIHEKSRRSRRSLVPVNCAALPGELLESEMFGHRRGAFTGAVREKPGLLETADGGTLFLDELIEMPVALQAKLLRVIQDGAVRRVGSEEVESHVDVRFVSATNRDPEEAIECGELRKDLFYRLRVVPISLPPLRERREDIPVLIRNFMTSCWRRHRGNEGPPPAVSPAAMDALFRYEWPGNVRELENMVEQLVIFAEPDAEIPPEDLPLGNREPSSDGSGGAEEQPSVNPMVDFGRSYHDAKERVIERFEKEYLSRVVVRADGNLAEAARQSGVDRTTLYRLMEKHDLSRKSLTA